MASTWLGRSRILRTSTCRPRAHSSPGTLEDLIKTRLWSCLTEALRFPLSTSTIERTALLRVSEGLARCQLWICQTMTTLLFEWSEKGDRWTTFGQHWMRIHELPRTSMYIPQLEGEGPELSTLVNNGITFKFYDHGGVYYLTDDWRS